MAKVHKDWVTQPWDQGTPPRKHFVLWGVFWQFGLAFMVFTAWVILNIPGRLPLYDQVPPMAEQWRNFGSLLGSVSADMKHTGEVFANDSAWLLPALLAVVIACYAVVVAGGRADAGTPIRAIRPLMTSITLLIGTIAWLWGGVLILEASYGHLDLPRLWAPITLTAIVAFVAAGFINFGFDPPHVRVDLLGTAADAHRESTKLSNLSAMPQATFSLRQARIRTILVPIGIGFVGALIYVLSIYLFETDPVQRPSGLWTIFLVIVLDFIIWFGWTAAGLWVVLDHALGCRTRAIWSRRTAWVFVVGWLCIYLFLIWALSQSPSERLSFLVSNGFLLSAIVLFTWVPGSRRSRMMRSYCKEKRAGKSIKDAQKELYDEHPYLRQKEDAKTQTRGETVKASILDLVAAVIGTTR